ncbi:MAG TPA: hypothetical protein PKA37_18585, partial [Planctomycetota bacterium]|nr:hypothetical protein [Planctomycetota bacterium]
MTGLLISAFSYGSPGDPPRKTDPIMKRITGDPSSKSCTNAACSVHHPAKPGDAPRFDRPVEMEVVRPDGRRVIRHIVPMDSCIEGTCGQAFMTSKPSSALVSTSSWGLSSMDILDLMGT